MRKLFASILILVFFNANSQELLKKDLVGFWSVISIKTSLPACPHPHVQTDMHFEFFESGRYKFYSGKIDKTNQDTIITLGWYFLKENTLFTIVDEKEVSFQTKIENKKLFFNLGSSQLILEKI